MPLFGYHCSVAATCARAQTICYAGVSITHSSQRKLELMCTKEIYRTYLYSKTQTKQMSTIQSSIATGTSHSTLQVYCLLYVLHKVIDRLWSTVQNYCLVCRLIKTTIFYRVHNSTTIKCTELYRLPIFHETHYRTTINCIVLKTTYSLWDALHSFCLVYRTVETADISGATGELSAKKEC